MLSGLALTAVLPAQALGLATLLLLLGVFSSTDAYVSGTALILLSPFCGLAIVQSMLARQSILFRLQSLRQLLYSVAFLALLQSAEFWDLTTLVRTQNLGGTSFILRSILPMLSYSALCVLLLASLPLAVEAILAWASGNLLALAPLLECLRNICIGVAFFAGVSQLSGFLSGFWGL